MSPRAKQIARAAILGAIAAMAIVTILFAPVMQGAG